MHVRQLPLASPLDVEVVRRCSELLMAEWGPMLACAWPEMERWLEELVPELADDQPPPPFPDYQLNARETGRLLSPEFDTISPVSNDVLLARLLLAAARHSELSIVFVPQHVSRGHLVGLLRIADVLSWPPADQSKRLRAEWLLDVGSYDVDDPVLRIYTDSEQTLVELADRLAPLSLATIPPEEHSP